MTLEELRKENEDDFEDEEKEEDKEDESEDTNKSFDEALLETISTLTEHVKSLSESHAYLESVVAKALETKPDAQLNIKPKESDKEDIGADVVVPDTYQSNSVQAGLNDDKSGSDKPSGDKSGLSMQKKAETVNFDFTTETPRPNAAIESVNKSSTGDYSLILKDAREAGYDGLSQIAQRILKGDYYTPSEEERLF